MLLSANIYIYIGFCGDVFGDFASYPRDNGFGYGPLDLEWKKEFQRSAEKREFYQGTPVSSNREVDRGVG